MYLWHAVFLIETESAQVEFCVVYWFLSLNRKSCIIGSLPYLDIYWMSRFIIESLPYLDIYWMSRFTESIV